MKKTVFLIEKSQTEEIECNEGRDYATLFVPIHPLKTYSILMISGDGNVQRITNLFKITSY